MKPHYSKNSVQPVIVNKVSDNLLSIKYREFPETVFYSKGVNYVTNGGVTKVYIDRCNINSNCKPMLETKLPLDESRMSEVFLPYNGEKIVMVYLDAEEQIYP
ncbi:hypothetical protein [Neisseria sp. Ec49-e6-T10]|uniref:hypothetical protein n=1 Tax=Neisseria sp. Ec49-e6-T10 TaxID=3140744 RepID=UPI003EBCB8AC